MSRSTEMRHRNQGSTRRAIVLLIVALSILLTAAGCGSDSSADDTRLVLTGSSTVAPLMAEIGKRYEERHSDVRVDVQTGGSSRGIADARSGVADIGMVSRALDPGEEDLTAHTIARDGIAMIVHADNPVRSLTEEQIVAIYTGDIDEWSEVGGPEEAITVVNKAEGRSTLELFLDYFGLDVTVIRADTIIGDNEQGIKTVAGNPGAIGYVSIGAAEVSMQNATPIKLLPLNGVEATTANVANGSFPLTRELNLVTAGAPAGTAADLIAFARSEDVHDLVRQLNFVPVE